MWKLTCVVALVAAACSRPEAPASAESEALATSAELAKEGLSRVELRVLGMT